MRSISCALISFVAMYMGTHIKGSDRINTECRGIFVTGSFIFWIAAILLMLFGL